MIISGKPVRGPRAVPAASVGSGLRTAEVGSGLRTAEVGSGLRTAEEGSGLPAADPSVACTVRGLCRVWEKLLY